MRALGAAVVLLALTLAVGLAVLGALASRDLPAADPARANDVAHRLAAVWPHPGSAGLADTDGLLVVDAQGRPLWLAGSSKQPTGPVQDPGASPAPSPSGSGAPPTTADNLTVLGWSAQHRPLAAPVVVEDRVVAWVFVDDDHLARLEAHQRQVAWAGAGTLVVAVALMAALLAWLHARVLAPFTRLERFAARVADGDLSAPLEVERGQAFGAWSQSFDLLRTELAAARRREAEERASKEALIAEIGHDLRTPVATICATAELLELSARSPADAERLAVIQAKGRQVDALIGDLFHAHDSQIAALGVTPEEMSSQVLADLVRQADHRGLARIGVLPAVLVRADRRRLAQVVDNIVQNSYKYADTPIEVTGRLDGESLELSLTDSGPGVQASEIGLILARGQRGDNAAGTPGHGLGLFICAQLMERMGGHIRASLPQAGGLRVTLTVPLA